MILNFLISIYDNILTGYFYFIELINIYYPEKNYNYINYNLEMDRIYLSNNNNKISLDRKININIKDLYNYLGTNFTSKSSLVSCTIIDNDNKDNDITNYVNKVIEVRKKFNIYMNTIIIDLIPEKYLNNIKEIYFMTEMFDEYKLDYILNSDKNITELV